MLLRDMEPAKQAPLKKYKLGISHQYIDTKGHSCTNMQNAISSLRPTSQLYNQDIASSKSPHFSDGWPSQTPLSNHIPGWKYVTK